MHLTLAAVAPPPPSPPPIGGRGRHTAMTARDSHYDSASHGVSNLSCLIHASCWANAPRWGGRLRCWLAAPLPLPQTWTCCAVQIATRVPLSLYLGPRLVNAVSLRKRPNSLSLQHKLSPYPGALQHIFPPPLVLRQLLPLRHLRLTQQRLHPSYLLALHCCFLSNFC